jgi:hypothetical protein
MFGLFASQFPAKFKQANACSFVKTKSRKIALLRALIFYDFAKFGVVIQAKSKYFH